MDIFIIKISDNTTDIKSLIQFQKKEISDSKKLYEHCLSYFLSDKILKEFYNINTREINFDKKNKPILICGEKFFSISHSDDYIAIAFSDNDCGIDIEKIKPRNFEKIAKRMRFDCNNQEEFYLAWTKYEAKYKLAKPYQSLFNKRIENYILTAVSDNFSEEFKIYIQNGNTFSNVKD